MIDKEQELHFTVDLDRLGREKIKNVEKTPVEEKHEVTEPKIDPKEKKKRKLKARYNKHDPDWDK